MASELKVDKFTGVTTAGSILVTGEGNSTTTNLQQGLAKVWIELRTVSGSPADGDSLNVSSLDDDATGRFTVHPSNNMGGVYNSKTMSPYSTTNTDNMIQVVGYDDQSASQFQLTSVDEGNSAADMTSLGFTVHGDLA
tara:strand:- start:425 stop:838 length:414 start_codon:yes stop_codon:yes gene_type:complete